MSIYIYVCVYIHLLFLFPFFLSLVTNPHFQSCYVHVPQTDHLFSFCSIFCFVSLMEVLPPHITLVQVMNSKYFSAHRFLSFLRGENMTYSSFCFVL